MFYIIVTYIIVITNEHFVRKLLIMNLLELLSEVEVLKMFAKIVPSGQFADCFYIPMT